MNLRSRLESTAPSTWPNLAWAAQLDVSCPPSYAPWRVASTGQYLVVANEVRLYVVTPDGYAFLLLAAVVCFHGFALDGDDLYVVDGPVLLKYDLSSEKQGEADGPDLAVNLLANVSYTRGDRAWSDEVPLLYARRALVAFSAPVVRSGSDQLAVFVLSADGHVYARSTNFQQSEVGSNGVAPDALLARLQSVGGNDYFCYAAGGNVITVAVDADVLRFDSSVALPQRDTWPNATAWMRGMQSLDTAQPWTRLTTVAGKMLVTQSGSMVLLASGGTLTLVDFGPNGIPQIIPGGSTPTPAGTVRSSSVTLRALTPPAPLPDAMPLLVADQDVVVAYVPVGGYTSTFELHKYQFPALTVDQTLTTLWSYKATNNAADPGYLSLSTTSWANVPFAGPFGPDTIEFAAMAQQCHAAGVTGDLVSPFARPPGFGTRTTAPPAVEATFRADPNTSALPFTYRLYAKPVDALVVGGTDGFWVVPLSGGGPPVHVLPPVQTHIAHPLIVGSTLYCVTETSLLAYALATPEQAPTAVPIANLTGVAFPQLTATQWPNGNVRVYVAAQDVSQQHWTVASYDANLTLLTTYVSPTPGGIRSALVATTDPNGTACVLAFDPTNFYQAVSVELDATTLQPVTWPTSAPPSFAQLRCAASDQPWCFAVPDRIGSGVHTLSRADAGGIGRVVIQHSDLSANTNAVRVVTFNGPAPNFGWNGGLDKSVTPSTSATIATLPTLTYGGASMLVPCAAPYLQFDTLPQAIVLVLAAQDRTVHVQRYPLPAGVADTTWPGFWQAEFSSGEPPPPSAPVADDDWNLYHNGSGPLAGEQAANTYGIYHV